MPMIPLGLKETKDIDFRDPFKVSVRHVARWNVWEINWGFFFFFNVLESSVLQVFAKISI